MRFIAANYFAWGARRNGKRVIRGTNPYYRKIMKLKGAISSWDHFFETSVEDRNHDWDELDSLYEPLRMEYAWAVPDRRSLNILKEFSPLVEVAAGNGYWSALLLNMGVDIIPVDVYVNPKKCWTEVFQGGPEVLLNTDMRGRNLFLCYPDEQESIAIVCLENFTGEYILHVGEMMLSGTVGGVPQAPFGRTSSAEFQVALQEQFHCILIANLELKLPYGKDTISVWKRTKYVPARIYSTHDGSHDDCHHSGSSLDSLFHDGSSGYLAGRTDSDMDNDSGSEGDLEEDNGQDSVDEDKDEEGEEDDSEEEEESRGPLTTSAAADAVTYMSISDLNKLRESSESQDPKNKSKNVSQLANEDSITSLAKATTGNRKQRAGAGAKSLVIKPAEASIDHVTYMSTEELAQLRNTHSGTVGLNRGSANSKRSRGGKMLGYTYADDEEGEEEEEEKEEEEVQDSRSRSGTGNRHKQHQVMDEESDEEDEVSAVHRMREEALDSQYEESEGKLWAAIPADEMLPVDRAAPCLQHLLIPLGRDVRRSR